VCIISWIQSLKSFNIIKIEWQQVHSKLIGEYDVQTNVAQLLIFSHNHLMVSFFLKWIYPSISKGIQKQIILSILFGNNYWLCIKVGYQMPDW